MRTKGTKELIFRALIVAAFVLGMISLCVVAFLLILTISSIIYLVKKPKAAK